MNKETHDLTYNTALSKANAMYRALETHCAALPKISGGKFDKLATDKQDQALSIIDQFKALFLIVELCKLDMIADAEKVERDIEAFILNSDLNAESSEVYD
jgi:hypothetical protein